MDLCTNPQIIGCEGVSVCPAPSTIDRWGSGFLLGICLKGKLTILVTCPLQEVYYFNKTIEKWRWVSVWVTWAGKALEYILPLHPTPSQRQEKEARD